MARKTTTTPVAAVPVHVEAPPEMDYAAHEKTWTGFVAVTKWSIVAAAIGVVVLYFLINP